MRTFVIVIFTTSLFISSCKEEIPDPVTIRLLPCDLVDSSDWPQQKPHLLRLYAVTTLKDTTDKLLQDSIDLFTCKVLDSLDIRNYRGVVIDFLKETKWTKLLKNSEVTDDHDPYGKKHETMVKYIFGNGAFLYRASNKKVNSSFAPPCLLPTSP